jgi:DNA transposition AAA+ family ATPase
MTTTTAEAPTQQSYIDSLQQKSRITAIVKQQIVAGLKEKRALFGGHDKAFAIHIGINPAQLSQIFAGNTFQVLSEAKWATLARLINYDLLGRSKWKTARTAVYDTIFAQLKKCQERSLSSMFCDEAGIGKTYTAKEYTREHKYAVYIDCSLVKNRTDLIKKIAREFGLEHTGRLSEIFGDLTYYLIGAAQSPLVILDEAGDLDYPAFLELKALWNATEGACGWYMMGADGLKAKIRRCMDHKRVGYAEIFSRYGKRFQRVTPEGKEEREKFFLQQATQVIKANAPASADVQKILVKSEGSLRRVSTELSKL